MREVVFLPILACFCTAFIMIPGDLNTPWEKNAIYWKSLKKIQRLDPKSHFWLHKICFCFPFYNFREQILKYFIQTYNILTFQSTINDYSFRAETNTLDKKSPTPMCCSPKIDKIWSFMKKSDWRLKTTEENTFIETHKVSIE